MSWTDQRLVWDPNDYDGIESVLMTTYQKLLYSIWYPAVVSNTAVTQSFSTGKAKVHSNGTVNWFRHGSITFVLPFEL